MSKSELWLLAMEARKSSTCLSESELCSVSRGQMDGTMEYNSKPGGEQQPGKLLSKAVRKSQTNSIQLGLVFLEIRGDCSFKMT